MADLPFRNAIIATIGFFGILVILSGIHNYNTAIFKPTQLTAANPRKRYVDPFAQFQFKTLNKTEFQPFQHEDPTLEELKKSTWTFLHLVSATYPVEPTKEEQAKLSFFLKALAEFHPAEEFGQDLLGKFIKRPAEATDREEFMHYLCEQHNAVKKEKEGKEEFKCENVVDHWGGQCGCGHDAESADSASTGSDIKKDDSA